MNDKHRSTPKKDSTEPSVIIIQQSFVAQSTDNDGEGEEGVEQQLIETNREYDCTDATSTDEEENDIEETNDRTTNDGRLVPNDDDDDGSGQSSSDSVSNAVTEDYEKNSSNGTQKKSPSSTGEKEKVDIPVNYDTPPPKSNDSNTDVKRIVPTGNKPSIASNLARSKTPSSTSLESSTNRVSIQSLENQDDDDEDNKKQSTTKIRKCIDFAPTTNTIESTTALSSTDDSLVKKSCYHDDEKEEEHELRYYRIVYRGVVALLSEPPSINNDEGNDNHRQHQHCSKKSGTYLSYGEIFSTRQEIFVEVDDDESENEGEDSNTTGDNNNDDIDTGKQSAPIIGSTPLTPQRDQAHRPSPRLGSAVSSPVLSDVWERQLPRTLPPSSTTIAPGIAEGRGKADLEATTQHLSTSSSFDDQRETYSVPNQTLRNEEDVISTATTTATSNKVTAITQQQAQKAEHPRREIRKKRKMIRIDQILTGGYAMDATDSSVNGSSDSNNFRGMNIVNDRPVVDIKSYEKTPKRGNGTHNMLLSVLDDTNSSRSNSQRKDFSTPKISNVNNVKDNPSGIGRNQNQSSDGYGIRTNDKSGSRRNGFMFLEQNGVPIAVPLTQALPECEEGNFLYRVVSSTPLPILTGPRPDAPKTQGILIPGTVHDVCLRVASDEGHRGAFLRLTRRRGWVMSGKYSTTNRMDRAMIRSDFGAKDRQWITTMKELPPDNTDGTSISSRVSTTTVSSTIATPVSSAQRRHRPPRRRQRERMAKDAIDIASLPRHVIGPAMAARNDTSTLTDTSLSYNNGAVQQATNDPRAIASPSSNISLLSDESSLEHHHRAMIGMTGGQPLTPDRSVARTDVSSPTNYPSFFLMRVNAPRGLKILDAPHFQVNNLIHGTHGLSVGPSDSGGSGSHGHGQSSHTTISPLKDPLNQSIFHTMTGTTTMARKTGNPAIFDPVTKSRRLPRGAVFEASKRMEKSGVYSQGAGLVKLSDNSGWAVIPKQGELDEQYRNYSGSLAHTREGEATRAFEEVGNALPEDLSRQSSTLFVRVLSKSGLMVSLPPPPSVGSDVETSPTSSTAGSSVVGGVAGVVPGGGTNVDNSDVASSVASSFLDAFRTPRKQRERDTSMEDGERKNDTGKQSQTARSPVGERGPVSFVIPCGMCVEIDRWVVPADGEHHLFTNEYARLRGGQGWIPRSVNGRPVVETISPPEARFGSFWFRVQDQRGIKVRLGPSRRAPSIKSDDGVYFRFECGEFLRASEVITFFRRNSSVECYAKLYRNRHIRLQTGIQGEVRSLPSLTAQAEWVQVFGDGSLYLEECATEPRIERHRQGWRYNVVLDARIAVRKGPSFAAETDGVVLLGGESVLVNERVTGPDETITWLRLKDGLGWVHTVGQDGEVLMIAHSLRHRTNNGVTGRPTKSDRGRRQNDQEDIAYNTIIARLFHNDIPGNESPPRRSSRRLRK